MHDRAESPLRTRQLIHFPIIHTPADMGTLDKAVQRATVHKSGVRGWRHKRRAVEQMWTAIERILQELPLPFPQVRLYQDGLPVCGKEQEIVNKLARQGSRNHQLLLDLMQRGATLEGTESAQLLRQEYAAVKRQLSRSGGSHPARGEDPAATGPDSTGILARRNRFIAQRINETLRPGETGILFLGMLHHVAEFLEQDIEISYPLKPPSNKVTS